ncbi:MAG: TetR/AcrR family transcriptional regulator C-terminal domain-containing protein [Candidatus Caenarcaniphilales bacterium]|nr:TetR/AcrR family transcriptional regulator C-terminal domain-containing protein [Candidatus Caenarcaniphilales bacterium]
MIRFGINLLNLVSDSKILRFDRLVLSQSEINPKMANFFYERACLATYLELERIITHGQKQGFIKAPDEPELIADILLNSWKGRIYEHSLHGCKTAKYSNPAERVSKVLKIVLDL